MPVLCGTYSLVRSRNLSHHTKLLLDNSNNETRACRAAREGGKALRVPPSCPSSRVQRLLRGPMYGGTLHNCVIRKKLHTHPSPLYF